LADAVAVHVQPTGAVTAKEDVPPEAPNETLAGETA
jgi:hypothetical protein